MEPPDNESTVNYGPAIRSRPYAEPFIAPFSSTVWAHWPDVVAYGAKYVHFAVNTLPILDGKGAVRGVLATFDDLTDLETKRFKLRQTVAQLQKSRMELQDKAVSSNI
jgi:hypothetical protein